MPHTVPSLAGIVLVGWPLTQSLLFAITHARLVFEQDQVTRALRPAGGRGDDRDEDVDLGDA